MSPKIGTVSHGLIVYFKNIVIKIKCICKRSTGENIKIRKINNMSFFFCREKIGQAYLRSTAYHADTLYSTNLRNLYLYLVALTVPAYHCAGAGNSNIHSCLNVCSSAYDINGFGITYYSSANFQSVGIRMGEYLLYLTDNYLVKLFS